MSRWLFALMVVSGCGAVAQAPLEYDAYALGSSAIAVVVGDFNLTLSRAELAFGPVYFCASRTAKPEQCETAVSELLSITTVNALDPTPQPLGRVRGLSGAIRSAAYDWGITWLSYESAPNNRAALGHSAIFEGTLSHAGESVPFTVTLDVVSPQQGVRAVLAARLSAELEANATPRLEVSFSPQQWWAAVDLAALWAQPRDPSGRLVIDASSDAYAALFIAMTANAPPSFTWSEGP